MVINKNEQRKRPRNEEVHSNWNVILSFIWHSKILIHFLELPIEIYHRCQLVYCSEGVMNVTAPAGTWVVPPQRAVWMPANIPHTIMAKTNLSFRSIYIDPSAAPWLPTECCVVGVSTLLRSLILAAVEIPLNYQLGGREERIMNLILDEISGITAIAGDLHLPEPKDPRLRPIVEAIKKNPADRRDRDQERPAAERAGPVGHLCAAASLECSGGVCV